MKLKSLAAILIIGIGMGSAAAADYSFTGNFRTDNEVAMFGFSVGSASTVQLRTWSYAGGTNAAGTAIARGGFDPVLTLFMGDGTRIGGQDDGGCALVATDAVTGQCWDTNFTSALAAGNYIATIQQFNNFAAGANLSDGFLFDGAANANFRNGFVDASDNKRDSHWAFDILNVNQADVPTTAVPEPGTFVLLGLGILGMAVRRKQRA